MLYGMYELRIENYTSMIIYDSYIHIIIYHK